MFLSVHFHSRWKLFNLPVKKIRSLNNKQLCLVNIDRANLWFILKLCRASLGYSFWKTCARFLEHVLNTSTIISDSVLAKPSMVSGQFQRPSANQK